MTGGKKLLPKRGPVVQNRITYQAKDGIAVSGDTMVVIRTLGGKDLTISNSTYQFLGADMTQVWEKHHEATYERNKAVAASAYSWVPGSGPE